MGEQTPAQNLIRYQVPVIAWAIVIFISSSIPSESIPNIKVPGFDKLVHFGIFFVFAALTHRAIKHQSSFPFIARHDIVFTIGFTALYGLLDEIHQVFVPGRNPSVMDLMADALGACLYIGVAQLLKVYRAKGGDRAG
jgi:VanZ family protein